MATQHASPVYLNGHGNGIEDTAVNQFYEKLLRLHEEILAGNNPRLKVIPAKAQAAKRVDASLLGRNAESHQGLQGDSFRGVQGQYASMKNGYASSSSFVENASQTQVPPNPATSTPQHRLHPIASSPKINPVLLQKSEHLIRAEKELANRRKQQQQNPLAPHHHTEPAMQPQHDFAIQRNMLEKALVQQLDTIRAGEAETPTTDVAGALATAQRIVPPARLTPSPPAQSAATSPFDENSYYSSKANSWSTEQTDPQGDPSGSDAMLVSDDEDLYEPPIQVVAPSGLAPSNAIIERNATIPGLHEPSSQQDWEPEWDDEEEDDGEDYEPPAQDAFEDHSHDLSHIPPQQLARSAQHNMSQQFLPAGVQGQHNRRQGRNGGPTIIENRIRSPISIVVNQIPTPAAPQPARISPLALGKMAPTQPPQFASHQQQHQRVPSGPGAQHLSGRRDDQHQNSGKKQPRQEKQPKKKERREFSNKKRKHNGSPEAGPSRTSKKGKRRAATPERTATPEPVIKPEPISPPPGLSHGGFAPSRRTSGVQRERAEEVLIASPRIARPHSAYHSDFNQSPRGYRYAEDSDRIPLQQESSPYRRPERDHQHLRRVASLQYARQVTSPTREIAEYVPRDSRGFAPAPYGVEIERPRVREAAYAESMGSDGTRYIRVARSPSPTYRVDPYARAQTAAIMAPPPPRQVIVDEYGNRYYPEPPAAADYRRSVAPQPRLLEADPYYERASTREPTLRPVRVVDPYEGDPYRGMPPPSRTRAFTHVPEDVAPHGERAFSVRPQEGSPRDAPPRSYSRQDITDRRPPPRFEAPPPPAREYVPRAYSVHPNPSSRREPLPEYAPRTASVQPGAYTRQDMPPPPVHIRAPNRADDGYHGPPQSSRGPALQQRDRHVSRRGGGEPPYEEHVNSPYGRRIISYNS